MFTGGCTKQYKNGRNFRFMPVSVWRVSFIVEHHFAATSHVKGCHDSIRAEADNAMKHSKARGNLIDGSAGVVCFLKELFDHIEKKGITDYFVTWSPYRIRRVRVKRIGAKEILRPQPALKSIPGTREPFCFVGANPARPDASPTTRLGRKPRT